MNDLAVDILSRLGWASVLLGSVGAVAYVVLRLLRVRTPSVHGFVWWVVLLLGLVLFPVTLSIPWYEPTPPVAMTSASAVNAFPGAIGSMPFESMALEPAMEMHVVPAETTAVARMAEEQGRPSWPIFVGAVWLGGIAVFMVRWIWGYTAFLQACRSRPCDRLDWTQQWGEILEESGITKPVPLHLGFGVGPALVRHPAGYRLIVPVRLWRRLSHEQRQCVMQHELAHYRRGDVWRLLVARLLALPHWFNPIAWYAVGAIELASEYACDDYASRGEGAATTEYARTLLAIGQMDHRAPAWTSAGGGGCLFKRIARVLSVSQTKDSTMKKALVLVVILAVALVGVVRVELVAQEAPPQSPAIGPYETTASVVTRIRELAKPAPIPFEQIEAIAAEAAGTRQAGPVYAEVAMAYQRHGNPARTMKWAQAALRQDLKSLDRLGMFRYWAEAEDLVHERDDSPVPPTLMWPVVWGLLEASRLRIPVEGFPESSGPQEESASKLFEGRDELVEHRDALVRLVAKKNKELGFEVKRFLLSEGLKGAERTPDWFSEGRAMTYTFRIDPAVLLNDLRPVFDAWVGERGAFDDVIEGIKEDKHGPQVDLNRELFPFLGKRVTIVADDQEPSLGRGEQFLCAVEVTDSERVSEVCDRLYEPDSSAHRVIEGGVTIWVFEPGEQRSVKQATCVAHGYLMSGDFELLRETLGRVK